MSIDGSKPCVAAWAILLGIDPPEPSTVMEQVGQVFELIVRSREQITAQSDLRHDLYLGAIKNVEEILLGQSPQSAWSGVVNALRGPNMIALEFCADALDSRSSEVELEQDELVRWLGQIDELIERLVNSELDLDLVDVLMEHAQSMRLAVLRYRVGGAQLLERSATASLGAAVLVQTKAQTEAGRTIMKDYLAIVQGVVSLAGSAKRAMPLLVTGLTELMARLGDPHK